MPVGVGSDGSPYTPQPHEYDLDGFDAVDSDTELRGGRAVLMDALRSADAASLTFLLISSQRDLAQVICDAPELFRAKTRRACREHARPWAPCPRVWESLSLVTVSRAREQARLRHGRRAARRGWELDAGYVEQQRVGPRRVAAALLVLLCARRAPRRPLALARRETPSR